MRKNLYYELWVDIIIKMRSRSENRNTWKIYSFIFMNMAMALNLAFVMAIFQRNILGFSFYNIKVDIFKGQNFDAFISFFLLYLLPNLILNYFLIFRNKRYEILTERYKYHEGRLFNRYFIASLSIPILLILIGKLIF
jgi:hypothetical protein